MIRSDTKMKVGDRVRYRDGNIDGSEAIGTIVDIDDTTVLSKYLVEFDDDEFKDETIDYYSGCQLEMIGMKYKDFHISYDPKPIPVRCCDWDYVHVDYEPDGEFPGGSEGSKEDCIKAIDEWYDEQLLKFAESIANHSSAQLHGHFSSLIREARRIVKGNGGHLKAIGRYPEGGTTPKPHSRYVDDRWTTFSYCHESDTWIPSKKTFKNRLTRHENDAIVL